MINILKKLKSDKATLKSIVEAFNTTSISVNNLSKKFGGLDDSVIAYLNSIEKGKASINGISEAINDSASTMTSAITTTKLLSAALNALSGLAFSLVIKGITWAISELIVTLDKQKEKLNDAVMAYKLSESELSNINNELKTTAERIDELNARDSLTFTEQDELDRLIETNDELERKIYLLQQANQKAEKEVATEAQKTYNKYTNNRVLNAVEQIDFYTNSSLLVNVNWDNWKDDLSWLIAQYKRQEELLANAQVNGWSDHEAKAKSDLELLEEYMAEASIGYQDLYEKISSISDFAMTDDLELAKQDLDDMLDIVAEILGYSGQRFETDFNKTWNSADFVQSKTELEALAKDGKLNADVLESNEQYKKLLTDTGATAEDVAQHIIALTNKMKQIGDSTLDSEPSSLLFTQLTTSQESLDTFQSSVKSASDAYSTLLSRNYSSSELLDSIQAINQAVSSMGGSLNWEFINSQSNSLEVLGNAIEYVSEQYADSILSGAGIDPDSDFGKILAENIIQAQKAATQLEAVNEQIDSLQEAYQNLTDAVDTYNQCGHITFDQLQNLLSMEPQYLACLTDENGQLQLNRQAMQNLADRRLYDAKVQAVQQAISELGTLTHHDEQKAITDSAQAFRDSVDDVSAYNMELAKTLTEAGIAAPLIRDLGAALNGAEERGASDVDIQTVINNLNAKMKLIGSVDIGNLSGASSSAVSQAETDWKSLLDKETDLLEKQLASNLITFQAYINKRRQVIKNYYLDGKITAEEYYDALESMYGSQLSLYDKAVNAVTGRIDDEIDQLNEQKEAIENSYQVKIDAIQEEIDALNKANDARKAQIDLEKAQYEAERARNQRVNKVYDGSQFVYAADVEAVRDAEENLADQKTQMNISRLEAQIESLEREMENATKGLDSQIEALESYKEKWNEISGIYEEQQSKLIVAEILGADWESQVLNGRLDTLRSFTEQYIALQQAQADAAANAARIKAEAAAGNATGGNVGNTPSTQKLDSTSAGKDNTETEVPLKKPSPSTVGSTTAGFNISSRFSVKMAHFHGGLDEGYATAPGQSTPANRSLSLLQKLAGENLLPNELPAILQHGELVITPEQQRNIIANTQRYCSLSSVNSGYASPYSGETSQIHIDSLTISCPNVTNNSGAEYILKSLERLPLDNIQHSHRRRY